jgi:subtilisin family serine protease
MQRYIVRLRPEIDRAAFIEEVIRGGGHAAYICSALPDRFAARLKSRHWAAIRSDPRVVSVTADIPFAVLSAETIKPIPDAELTDSWGLDRINQRSTPLDRRYSYGRNGTGVDCYVVDSGIRYDHEQIIGRAEPLPGFDLFGDAHDPALHDTNGHGTAVASLIAGRNYGVARRAKLYSVKVVGPSGRTFPSEFIDACYAIRRHHLEKAESRPSVANFSLRFPVRDPLINAAVRDLMIAGVTVVIAAGNDNQPAANFSPQSVELDFHARVRVTGTAAAVTFRVGSRDLTAAPVTGGLTALVDAMRAHSPVHGFRIRDRRHEPTLTADEFTIERFFETLLPEDERVVTATGPAGFFSLVVDPLEIRPLVVGASTPADNRWFKSNYGPLTHLLAPGYQVPAAGCGSARQQVIVTGTSFACPAAVGVAALHLTNKPVWRPGNPVVGDNSPRSVHAFIVGQATQGIVRTLPDGTPNRLLYSYYVVGEILWRTGGDLGPVDERTPVQISLEATVLDASGEPVVGAPVSYTATGLPDWLRLNAATGLLYGPAPTVEADQTVAFAVTADTGAGTLTRTFTLTVRNVNRPPHWLLPLDPEITIEVVERSAIPRIDFAAVEPDGQPITFAKGNPEMWPSWLTLTDHGRDAGYTRPPGLPDAVLHRASIATAAGVTAPDLPPGTPPQQFEALLLAGDGVETIARTIRIRVVPETNRPPVWQTPAGALPPIREGDEVSLPLLATDQDGDPLAYWVIEPADIGDGRRPGLPPGLSLNRTTGRITGTVGKVVLNEVFEFDAVVSDGTLKAVRRFTLAVENLTVPPPTWITPSGTIGIVLSGEDVRLMIQAEARGNAEITYTVVAGTLPGGLSLYGQPGDAPDDLGPLERGTIYGVVTPVAENIVHTFSVRAAADGSSRDRQFSITVLAMADQNVVEWVTPAGPLGTVVEETPSLLAVRARLPGTTELEIHYGIGTPSLAPDPKPGMSKMFLTRTSQQDFRLDAPPPLPAAVKVFTRQTVTGADTAILGFTWVDPRTVRLPSPVAAGTLVIVQLLAENTPRSCLPAGMGMIVCNNEALLIGRPRLVEAHQQVEIEMRAYTGPVHRPIGTSALRRFSFRVENAYQGDFLNVSLPLGGKERVDWQNWQLSPQGSTASPLIATARLFRACDRHFGRVLEPRIYLISGLKPPAGTGVAAVFDRFAQQIGPHHGTVTAVTGRPRLAVARNPETNAVLYELLYLPVLERTAGQDAQEDPPFPVNLMNFRHDLSVDPDNPAGTRFARTEDPAEILPLWMRSVQADGTTPGFVAALPVAYLKPGTGKSVLSRLQQTGLDRTLAGRVLTLDRYLVEYVRSGGGTQAATKYLKFPAP